MRAGEHHVARRYVIYREERRKAREILSQPTEHSHLFIKLKTANVPY